jgi:hypothetical protein
VQSTAVEFFSEGERIAGLWPVPDDDGRYREALTAAGGNRA